jgi:hypothetical protein
VGVVFLEYFNNDDVIDSRSFQVHSIIQNGVDRKFILGEYPFLRWSTI